MTLKRTLLTAGVSSFALMVGACTTQDLIPDEGRVKCTVESSPSGPEKKCEGELIWRKADNLGGSADASGALASFALQNTAIRTTAGRFLMQVYEGNSLVAAKDFGFYRVGNKLYADNPSQVNYWLNQFLNSVNELKISLPNLKVDETTSQDGAIAQVTMRAKYFGDSAGTYTDSWVIDNGSGGGGGIQPR